MAETRRLLSDAECEQLARDILAPFADAGLCSDTWIEAATAIIRLRVTTAENRRALEHVEAKIVTHNFLADVFKGLPS